jgi:hypothetical protein
MRCGGGVVAASLLAVQCLVLRESAAADAASEGEHFDRYLLFSGFDLWRNGGSAHGGLQWSPNGLMREGLTFKLLIAGGRYAYNSGGTDFSGAYALVSPQAGWRFKGVRFELTLLLGPDFQLHRLTPDDATNRLRGSHVGIRFGGDLWYQPSDIFMATGSLSLSTIGPNYWSRAAIGWSLFASTWIGPELMALGGDKYHQLRVGVHATAFRTAEFEWYAGLGYALDSDHRSGAYARLGVLTRR